ncbi:MAG: major facilitator superfamily 1 [Frankiales bacterium]|nr:major facilitator superfamily 1 [Frankiales bacterium]
MRAWGVWGIALSAYVVAVFDRASLGVSGVAAQHRFGATAAQLGLFGVLQLAVYAALQVPVGVLLDRFGSKRLIVTGAVFMAAGQLLLAQADSVTGAVLARVLVGAGDAMTFTSVLRLVGFWFPPRRVPLLAQLTGLLGQLGQVAAAYPLVYFLRSAGWSNAFVSAAALGTLVGAVCLMALRDSPPGTAVEHLPLHLPHVRSQLAGAWREPGTRLGLWTHFVTQFSGTVFALLWGYPFLVVGEGRTPTEAGLLLSALVVVGIGVAPVLGHLVGRWPLRRSIPTLTIVASTAAAWTLVLAWPGRAPLPVLVLLVVVLATNGPGSMVGFDYARTENPPGRIGSATGIVNVGGFVASLLTIAAIGLVLSALSTTPSLDDFRVAMSVQYAFWAVGVVMLIRTRRQVRLERNLVLDAFPAAVRRRLRSRLTD